MSPTDLQPFLRSVTPSEVDGAREDAATILRELRDLEATLYRQADIGKRAAENLGPAIERAEEVMRTFLTATGAAPAIEVRKAHPLRCSECRTDLMTPRSLRLGKCHECRFASANLPAPPVAIGAFFRHEEDAATSTLPARERFDRLNAIDDGEDSDVRDAAMVGAMVEDND